MAIKTNSEKINTNNNKFKIMKKLYSLLICLLVVVTSIAATWTGGVGSATSSFSGGDGSQATPYLISTPEELAYLAQQTNLASSFTTGKFYKLTADIELNSNAAPTTNAWIPIGTAAQKFAGNFDGDNHVISNIYINSTLVSQGLFGHVGAQSGTPTSPAYTIKNLTIASGSINFVTNGIIPQNYGVIVGRGDYVSILNCKNAASVRGYSFVGGIVGQTTQISNVENCINSGTIIATTERGGGIVGNMGPTATLANAPLQYLKKCFNSGAVNGTKYGGGIAGVASGFITISQCLNIGAIQASGGACGGIVGYGGNSSGTPTAEIIIDNCGNTGSVTGGSTIPSGGILGTTLASKWFKSISNCYNTGAVTGGTATLEVITGLINASAPSGFGTVSNSYYLSSLAATNTNGGTSKTATELKDAAFLTSINSGTSYFVSDFTPNFNGAYPVLNWQSAYSVLSAPTASVASSITATGFTASWTPVTGAVSYMIKVYDAVPALKFTFYANGQSTSSLPITGLLTNTFYSYTVTAVGGLTSFDSQESEKPTGIVTGAPQLAATATPTQLSATSVSIIGNVTSDGGVSPITARGICWGTTANPSLTDNVITDASTGLGSYTSTITGLSANTTYYVRAYATNATRTGYGSQVSFSILSTPTVGTADISSTGFTANWTAVASALSYDINVYQGANLIKTVNAAGQATASLAINGLANETAYTFTVVARGNSTSILNSAESAPSNSVTTSTATAINGIASSSGIYVQNKSLRLPEKGTLKIFSLQGAQLFQGEVNTRIDMNLNSGIYIVHFTNCKGIKTIQKISIL
jgi:hypothetical protein